MFDPVQKGYRALSKKPSNLSSMSLQHTVSWTGDLFETRPKLQLLLLRATQSRPPWACGFTHSPHLLLQPLTTSAPAQTCGQGVKEVFDLSQKMGYYFSTGEVLSQIARARAEVDRQGLQAPAKKKAEARRHT